jgi:xanthine dehydrogenase accessory factor
MREIIGAVARWRRAGTPVALARVVDVEGSGPRLPGAAMAVSGDGEVAGSVSGGCVEGAVVTEALEILGGGARRVVSFGYSDDDAFAVGLTCGGTVHLYIEPLDRLPWDDVTAAITAGEPVALVTIIDGPGTGASMLVGPDRAAIGTLDDGDLERVVVRDALGELAGGTSSVRHYGAHGEALESRVTVFIDCFAPPPQLLVFGAVDFTAALVRVAKVLGYRVTVCDPREVFATRARFPLADEIAVEWPNRFLERVGPTLGPRDAICVLTHDAKLDVPAITAALDTDVGFIGAMGSRRTTDERAAQLDREGVTADALARVMAPIGLDIGARTPEEVAISICAEIIARRTGSPAPSLRDASGPIH